MVRSKNSARWFPEGHRHGLLQTSARINEWITFKTECKTTEFHSRLNLPKDVIDLCGKESHLVLLEVSASGFAFYCHYEYREIAANKPICRLCKSWRNVVEFMKITQGDTLYFRGNAADPNYFEISFDDFDEPVNDEVSEEI
ncbi:hypothetical protein C2S53_012914 [Perilla frutescens var. hirtella]|uniref:Uncharacterized protein n=1 Tax=Perilla frutescens var. hirtella TaxID=608512 RepID=A0AAD4P7N1_PERFH|nr:hypothetical protein C2S53_012914 [Perilla frutescens var. hirtella]